jgi:hypothetical protein
MRFICQQNKGHEIPAAQLDQQLSRHLMITSELFLNDLYLVLSFFFAIYKRLAYIPRHSTL